MSLKCPKNVPLVSFKCHSIVPQVSRKCPSKFSSNVPLVSLKMSLKWDIWNQWNGMLEWNGGMEHWNGIAKWFFLQNNITQLGLEYCHVNYKVFHC